MVGSARRQVPLGEHDPPVAAGIGIDARLSIDGVADESTTGKPPRWPRTTAMSRAE